MPDQSDQSDYTVAANAMVPVINSDFNTLVPSWARGLIPQDAAMSLAGQLAKAVVDALNAHHAPPPEKGPPEESQVGDPNA